MHLLPCPSLLLASILASSLPPAQAQGKVATSSSAHPLLEFREPPAATRPKFRYWLPDASVPAAQVEADIAALAAASAGGLEFLPFYNYGLAPAVTDWSTYGFGTPAFRTLFRAALRAADAHGLVFDFALGPNQGAGVPAVPETPGLAMELVMGAETVNPGEKASASPPPPQVHFRYEPLQGFINPPELWGANELVAVVAAPVMSRGPRVGRGGGEQVVLDDNHTLDLTYLARDGKLDTWEPPAVALQFNGSWEVMAFYQRYTNERSCVSTPGASTWIGNGSWMVDHFSSEGAKKVTDFWDEYIFSDEEIKQLVQKTGGYSWEDSMEMMASLWWTRGFLDSFQKSRNSSAIPWMPVYFQAKNMWNSYSAPYNVSYSFKDYPTDGWKYVEDYRLTLNEGYQDYLSHTQAWAESNGFQHSAQPAYNLPLDMSSTIPLVGAPELESLGFRESIDLYRQFTGPAHIANRNVISTEIGAQRIGAYAQPLPVLLNLVRDSFAAGVNTLVIHGFPYGGTYYGTTWPGYTPFQYEFGEMWGPRQPAWTYLNDSMMYMGRNSLVLKTGVPKVDVAFLMWEQPWSGSVVYPGSNLLTAAGYTYEYLGDGNLALAAAVVRDKILAPEGPGYKALVIYNQTRITPAASTALVKLAESGLPIFIVGPFPLQGVGTRDQLAVTLNMNRLRDHRYPNVQLFTYEQFTPDVLKRERVFPRTTAAVVAGPSNGSSQLFTQWRVDAKTSLQLVYVLNRGSEATFTLNFNGTRTQKPYVLDAWTGEQSPLLAFDIIGDAVVTNITLSQQQSAIFAFSGSQNDTSIRINSLSPSSTKLWPRRSGGVEALLDGSSDTYITLSNGTNLTYAAKNVSAASKNTLGPWNLTLECQAAPAQLSVDHVTPNTTKHTIASPLATLVPWTKLPTAQHCSGTGTYRTAVNFPAIHTDDTAYTLHFTGRVLHTLRAFVNGAPVAAIDPSAPNDGRDISALLKAGNNEVRVEVSSTLFNAVKERLSDVQSLGMGPRVTKPYTETNWAEFGLVGEVVIKSWKRVVVL